MRKKSASFMRRANGSGSITKLSGKRRKPWLVRGYGYDEDGFATRPLVGTYAKKEEAILALAEWQRSQQHIANDATFAEIFEVFQKEKHKEKKSESTMMGDIASFKAWKALHYRPISELKTHDYQAIIDRLLESNPPPSKSKLTKMRSLISQMYGLMAAQGYEATNYARYISLRGVVQEKIKPFTDEDIRAIERLVSDPVVGRAARASMILAYTGLRINEFLALQRFVDIDLAAGLITTAGSKTTAGKSRTIPTHPRITPHIKHFLAEPTATPYLFTHKGRKVSDNYYRKTYHAQLMEQIGSDLNPHSFRHTASTLFRASGMSEAAIKQILGHESIQTTDKHYVNLPADYLTEQIKLVK